ncbi:MAG: Cu(I)-responsive transcriptional regulator [Parvibaculaceae bacterium]|nr:Cu(I)-responsive transcriptional regulator [Parvibaculaceae bacterium]
MNIGQAAERSSVPAKTIRYYEEIGLIAAPPRHVNGYRDYDEPRINELSFLASARRLGFSIDECRSLLSLYRDEHRASSDVKAIAASHVARIDAQIADLKAMRRVIDSLAGRCHGDSRSDCSIIDGLAARTAGHPKEA